MSWNPTKIPCFSVVRQPGLLVRERVLDALLPLIGLPSLELLVGQVVVLRNGVRADGDLNPVLHRDETGEGLDVLAGRIAHKHAGGQVDDIHAVLLHLGGHVFHVAAGASPAGSVAHQLDLLTLIAGEGTLTIMKGAEALAPSAGVIAVADDDAELFMGGLQGVWIVLASV